jgi:hypothetical protein
MKMNPREGVVADPNQNWCLADDAGEAVLIYSLAGPSIRLLRTLSPSSYDGLWFNPRTGKAQPVEGAISGQAGSVIQKPTAEPWLILLNTR